jgi:ferredoxin
MRFEALLEPKNKTKLEETIPVSVVAEKNLKNAAENRRICYWCKYIVFVCPETAIILRSFIFRKHRGSKHTLRWPVARSGWLTFCFTIRTMSRTRRIFCDSIPMLNNKDTRIGKTFVKKDTPLSQVCNRVQTSKFYQKYSIKFLIVIQFFNLHRICCTKFNADCKLQLTCLCYRIFET